MSRHEGTDNGTVGMVAEVAASAKNFSEGETDQGTAALELAMHERDYRWLALFGVCRYCLQLAACRMLGTRHMGRDAVLCRRRDLTSLSFTIAW